MSWALNEDQRSIQDLVRRVANEKVAARASEIDATAEYPHDMFALLKELGLFTLPFPVEYGGTGSILSASLAVEELGRICYNTAYLLVVQWVPFSAILAGGSEEQKQRFLPGLAQGDIRGALALTEAQSGSDLAGIKTRAVKVDGGYRLSGAKIWCSNAEYSDFVLVAARSAEQDGGGNINLYIVPRNAEGFKVGRKEDKLGARGIPSSALFLDDVFIPEHDRLGDEGKGFKSVAAALNECRAIVGARAVGLAQGALDHTVDFIKNRRAFGQSVDKFQGVRWMIADMSMQIEAARNLVYSAATAVDEKRSQDEIAYLAATSKCFASDMAMKVSENAVQLFGAAGISSEYPINRYFRDAKVLQIIEGTNQIQRNIISRLILGKP